MAHSELDKVVAERWLSEELVHREPLQTTSVDDMMSVVKRVLSTLEEVVHASPSALFPEQARETISATRQVRQKVAAERDSASECTRRSGKRKKKPTQVVGGGADGAENTRQTGGAGQLVAKKPGPEGVPRQLVAHLDELTHASPDEFQQAVSVAL